jgi:hypothetical protein
MPDSLRPDTLRRYLCRFCRVAVGGHDTAREGQRWAAEPLRDLRKLLRLFRSPKAALLTPLALGEEPVIPALHHSAPIENGHSAYLSMCFNAKGRRIGDAMSASAHPAASAN